MNRAFLLVVFDGLRPDMVRPDTTPNLVRFAAMGARLSRARSVFPSETRVCSSSVATGCLPRRHGLVANQFAHAGRVIDTGDVNVLRDFEQRTGAGILAVPTLGEILASHGHDLVVLSSGTTGQTYVLNPRADELGQLTLSAHGPHACSAAGRALFARLDPPPKAPPERAAWIADVFRSRFLPDPPAASIVWLCEPDTSGHYDGLFSPAQYEALRIADAAFGRILDDWQSGPQHDRLQIAVASDHGHALICGLHSIHLPERADCILTRGSSCGLAIPDADAARIGDIAESLIRQPWVGTVFAADGAELAPGILPRSALLADHPRAAQVLFTLRASQGETLYDGDLPVGSGTHGGLLAEELHTVLMFAGSAIAASEVSEWPAGLPDIAPTALSLLGLPGAAAMDGRILTEILHNGAHPTDSPAPESWEAVSGRYAQRLARTRLGRHVYLDEAVRIT